MSDLTDQELVDALDDLDDLEVDFTDWEIKFIENLVTRSKLPRATSQAPFMRGNQRPHAEKLLDEKDPT